MPTAANKSLIAFQASTSNAAGATTTGSAQDFTTALGGGYCVAKITNGGTGPTIGCDAIIEVSNDNSVWYEMTRATAGVTNSAVYSFYFKIPKDVMYVRTKFGSNTGQACTIIADGAKFASIG